MMEKYLIYLQIIKFLIQVKSIIGKVPEVVKIKIRNQPGLVANFYTEQQGFEPWMQVIPT